MSSFEFGMIPVAILIGFALNRLIVCWAHIFLHWQNYEDRWLFLSYSAIALVAMLSHFSSFWVYREIDFSLANMLLIVSPTLLLVLAITILVLSDEKLPANLGSYYFERNPKVSGLLAAGVLVGILPDQLPGVLTGPSLGMYLLFAATFAVMAVTSHRIVHGFCHVIVWGGLVAQVTGVVQHI